jgi:hypothetical protein
MPPSGEEVQDDAEAGDEPSGLYEEQEAGVAVNGDDELVEAESILADLDLDADDENWGIDVYCEAVILMISKLETQNDLEE